MTARAYRAAPTNRADEIDQECETWFERQIDRLDARLMAGEIGQVAYDLEFTRLSDRTDALIAERLAAEGLT